MEVVIRHVPNHVPATVLLAVFLCIFLTAPFVFGCSECLCFSDNSCSNDECMPGLTTNCTRAEFTPACSGDYMFFARVVCGAICSKCMACVSIYKLTGGNEYYITDVHNNGCNVGICESSTVTIDLDESQTYVMYVCKVPCPDGNSTYENFSESCAAYGCIAYGVTSTQCGP